MTFQSTHPYRVWLNDKLNSWCVDSVSIHTPIQGVTAAGLNPYLALQFQSTHPYRVWLKLMLLQLLRVCFNPHTHTGCDVRCLPFLFNIGCFNPHTHTGCDKNFLQRYETSWVSIHTPIQGVTARYYQSYQVIEFQSTHPYRVWPSFGKFSANS